MEAACLFTTKATDPLHIFQLDKFFKPALPVFYIYDLRLMAGTVVSRMVSGTHANKNLSAIN